MDGIGTGGIAYWWSSNGAEQNMGWDGMECTPIRRARRGRGVNWRTRRRFFQRTEGFAGWRLFGSGEFQRNKIAEKGRATSDNRQPTTGARPSIPADEATHTVSVLANDNDAPSRRMQANVRRRTARYQDCKSEILFARYRGL